MEEKKNPSRNEEKEDPTQTYLHPQDKKRQTNNKAWRFALILFVYIRWVEHLVINQIKDYGEEHFSSNKDSY